MTEPIPGPRGLPIIGNILDIRNVEGSLKGLEALADTYGEAYRLSVGGRKMVVVSSAELLLQFADEKQFEKMPPPALEDGIKGAKGLFTARGDDPDWGQAHRILAPAFGPLSVSTMMDGKLIP